MIWPLTRALATRASAYRSQSVIIDHWASNACLCAKSLVRLHEEMFACVNLHQEWSSSGCPAGLAPPPPPPPEGAQGTEELSLRTLKAACFLNLS